MSAKLMDLGRQLRESTTTANFEGVCADLKNQLKNASEVQLSVRRVRNGDQYAKNVFVYSFKSKRLDEEEIAQTSPESVWAEGKADSKTYISNQVYYVKQVDGGEKFEVTVTDGSTRKPFATLTKQALDQGFTRIRASETEDAEGYVQYRKVDEVEAFKYTGDTQKLNGVLIHKGDYLIRSAKGDEFVYEVKRAKDFDVQFTEKE